MKIMCRAGCAGEEEECLNIFKMIPPLVCFFVTLCHISITPTMRRGVHAVAVRSGRHSSDGSFWGSSGWLAAAIAGRQLQNGVSIEIRRYDDDEGKAAIAPVPAAIFLPPSREDFLSHAALDAIAVCLSKK